MTKQIKNRKRRPRSWKHRIVVGIIFVSLLLAVLPWVLEKTAFRDRLITWIVDNPSVTISTEGANLWYFSPLTIDSLRISSVDQTVNVQVDKIRAQKSWLRMVVDRPQLGSITFERPEIQIVADGNGADSKDPETENARLDQNLFPELTAIIHQGSIRLKQANEQKDAFNLRDFDIDLHFQREGGKSVLVADQITILDHEALTPEVSDEGLDLVAPMLAEELTAEASISLKIDKVRISFGNREDEDDLQITGLVTVHQATVGFKQELTRRLIAMTAEMLETDLPEKLVVTENAEIQFFVESNRVHHQGLGLAFPGLDSEILINSSGSVGLDESLDLQVTVREKTLQPAERDGTPSVTSLKVGGTIDNPEIAIVEK